MNDGRSSTFLALPEGSYFIKPRSKGKTARHVFLSALYIRANQQHDYLVEPLVDWFIMYENPDTKKPKFTQSITDNLSTVEGNGRNSKRIQKSRGSNKNNEMERLIILNEVTNSCLDKVDSNLIFNIKDAWIRNKFTNTVSEVIYRHVQTLNYHNCWSKWMLSWIIAKEVTEEFSPETEVPTELIKLVYQCLKKI